MFWHESENLCFSKSIKKAGFSEKRTFENSCHRTGGRCLLTKVNRTYKDTLFRLLFNDRKNLLSLYNAVNHTNYTNEEDLEINTLENAIYLKVKNDVSFVFNFYLNLYEHQASLNPNMPLRVLLFFITVQMICLRKWCFVFPIPFPIGKKSQNWN